MHRTSDSPPPYARVADRNLLLIVGHKRAECVLALQFEGKEHPRSEVVIEKHGVGSPGLARLRGSGWRGDLLPPDKRNGSQIHSDIRFAHHRRSGIVWRAGIIGCAIAPLGYESAAGENGGGRCSKPRRT